ncbi:MAG: D-glycero-alpha-D-manno-heptose 1-phosphate guanylyltransferase [Thermotogaceae bacterium]|nr:D-glycero-alpha-D-manno-heptose 1-phosphate guanylyltransferase [Thermotogaceae bacterium]
MIKEAIVLAGGLGTRLRSVAKDLPKLMVDVNGKPFLEYVLSYLEKEGIERVILSVGYKWETIFEYFGNKFKNLELVYSVETVPLGTGGAIKLALEKTQGDEIFVLNGDVYFGINLAELYSYHKEKKSNLTLALKEMRNFDRYGVTEIDANGRIIKFSEKMYRTYGLINGGRYVIDKKFFMSFNLPDKFSIEKDFFEVYYNDYKFYGKKFDNYFIDIGIPEDYEKAKKDFEEFANK